MRLFVFGIGGTGGRLMEALTFLLAAGMKMVDADGKPVELIPILLDTDATNKDTLDGVSALELYSRLHSKSDSATEGFFSTSMGPLASLAQEVSVDVSRTFRLNYRGVENATFRKFIGFDQIDDPATKRLLEALYSDDNMNDHLTGGFLGNPNVGAVVLSGFKNSPDFSLFANAFSQNDRVFIAGSLFGGTGAAGLPWLLKALRNHTQKTGSADAIRNSAIGALMVLPYFKLQEDSKSRIDSSVFITKTKAALSYYATHVRGLNAVYYIADNALSTYANHESGNEQSNDAHVVELLGALAILDFARAPASNLLPQGEKYYEYAINADNQELNLSTLGVQTPTKFSKQLTQLQMMALLDANHFRQATQATWAKVNGFNAAFYDSSDYRDGLASFLQTYYSTWIQQLASNRRAFTPFRTVPDLRDMSKMLTGRDANKKRFWGPGLSGELFDIAANNIRNVEHGAIGSLARFVSLWWQVTSDVYDESFGSM
jgi:hypothetical protein